MPEKAKETASVSESEFYMWRTLFAMAHADNVVSDEEIRFMAEILEDMPFSPEQKAVLTDDIKYPKDIGKMFGHITDKKDQAKFFRYAHDLVWIDGEYGAEEQDIMLKLQERHIRSVNVDDLVGKIELEFEDDESVSAGFSARKKKAGQEAEKKDIKKVVHSFRDRFLKERFNAGDR